MWPREVLLGRFGPTIAISSYLYYAHFTTSHLSPPNEVPSPSTKTAAKSNYSCPWGDTEQLPSTQIFVKSQRWPEKHQTENWAIILTKRSEMAKKVGYLQADHRAVFFCGLWVPRETLKLVAVPLSFAILLILIPPQRVGFSRSCGQAAATALDFPSSSTRCSVWMTPGWSHPNSNLP